ncbi:hypothetical protein Tco_0253447, partial [Tanacetum coccineum]
MVKSKKVESEKATENIYRKLMVTKDMVEYVLEKYGKNWKVEDEIADVILEDLQIKYQKDDKGKGKVKGIWLGEIRQSMQGIITSTKGGFGHTWAKWNGHTFTYLCDQ